MDVNKKQATKRKKRSKDRSIKYLDPSSLLRPAELPKKSTPVVIFFLIIAAIIGGIIFFRALDGLILSQQHAEQRMHDNIVRPVDTDLPHLPSLSIMTDADMLQTVENAGWTYVTITNPLDVVKGGFDIYRLPADLPYDKGASLYTKGITNLPIDEAALLLKGGFRLTVDRSNGLNVKVRYAEFGCVSEYEAISKAMISQGFDSASINDSGVDDSGNVYQKGTFKQGEATFNWRISTLRYSEVFNIGLPPETFYVGISVDPA